MDTEKLFQKLISEFDGKIPFLVDKPEETIESTVRACWFTAAGNPKSAERSLDIDLPELSEAQVTVLYGLLQKRLINIPLAHLTGRQNFMGIELLCDYRALIPRKETEILGKKALEISKATQVHPVKIMDICCGAGNLGLSLAYLNDKAKVYLTDLSAEATELARENADFLKVTDRVIVKTGDLFEAFDQADLHKAIQLIVCNPPYISTGRVSKMDMEISNYEPSLAFDGGIFGMKVIQRLITEAPRFLAEGGWLLFEVGLGQGDFIIRLCRDSNHYEDVSGIKDTTGSVRAIAAKRK